MRALKAPLSEDVVRSLKAGDEVTLSGPIFTARDEAHMRALEMHERGGALPFDLKGAAVYHCGPIMSKLEDVWKLVAAGPTTSIREEPYQGEVIRKFTVRAVIGKGGMGAKTLAALKEVGAVYLSAIGGAAQYYAKCIESVDGVDLLEFGLPEAMWHLTVKNFPAIVTMDAHGNSLHADIEKISGQELSKLSQTVY